MLFVVVLLVTPVVAVEVVVTAVPFAVVIVSAACWRLSFHLLRYLYAVS